MSLRPGCILCRPFGSEGRLRGAMEILLEYSTGCCSWYLSIIPRNWPQRRHPSSALGIIDELSAWKGKSSLYFPSIWLKTYWHLSQRSRVGRFSMGPSPMLMFWRGGNFAPTVAQRLQADCGHCVEMVVLLINAKDEKLCWRMKRRSCKWEMCCIGLESLWQVHAREAAALVRAVLLVHHIKGTIPSPLHPTSSRVRELNSINDLKSLHASNQCPKIWLGTWTPILRIQSIFGDPFLY